MNFLLLQINDSAFPIGSYTQSFGLETYVQKGLITNKDEAYNYLQSLLYTQMLYADLLMIKLVYEAETLESILYLESLMNASTPAKETRLGMQKIGSIFIKTLEFMKLDLPLLFKEYIRVCKYPTHPSAYAVFCKTMGIDFKESLQHYIYAQISNTLTNCVKLIPLSQYDGQAILAKLHTDFMSIYEKIQTLDEDDFCNAVIHNDMQGMLHETLHSRLYMS
ncbi:MAG: urease accessory protein UreF [Helicobacter trogontum]|uniref:urease accessory protein UreF n=1 Tax=Helicobacter trogontum TaxID=50960 RepID=UPI0024300702|nr:urease accessory protein UreF [Helicobacter trogontum]MCI5787583.1 urease accessory protein UreF [Helicobacter trogontum]